MKGLFNILIIVLAISLSGCLAGRALVGIGSSRAAVAAVAESTIIRVGVQRSLVRMVTSSGLTWTGATMTIENPGVFYSNLSKIRLLRNPGGNPKLILKDGNQAFGEILTKKGRVRLFDTGEQFYIKKNIFSVRNNVVNVMSEPSKSPSKIVSKIYSDDLVVVLRESNGWYYIEFLKDGIIKHGYVLAALLYPLVEDYLHEENDDFNLITCNSCKGKGFVHGRVSCLKCKGGYFNCYNCNGDGNLICESCNGDGSKACYSCKGAGEIDCSQCSGKGVVHCNSCKNQGVLECYGCKGKGVTSTYRNQTQRCQLCQGSRKLKCNVCASTGFIICPTCRNATTLNCLVCLKSGINQCLSCLSKGNRPCMVCLQKGEIPCNYCHGKTYEIMDHECSICYGYGKVEVEK